MRKITRGMWALDLLNDTILMALLPSLLVLLGSMILLGLHWPSLGAVIAVGTVIYVSMTVALLDCSTSRRPRASPMPGTPRSAARWPTR